MSEKSKKTQSTVSTKHFEQFSAQSLIAYAYENDVITVNEFRNMLRLPPLEQGRIVKRFYDKIKPNARLMLDKTADKADKHAEKSHGKATDDDLTRELAEAVMRKSDGETLVLPPLGSAKSAV